MNGSPAHVRGGRQPIDSVPKYIEHPAAYALAHGNRQSPSRILHLHAARQALRGRQCNAADALRIQLRHHFDDDLTLLTRAQHRLNGRENPFESCIDDAATNGDDHTAIGDHAVINRPVALAAWPRSPRNTRRVLRVLRSGRLVCPLAGHSPAAIDGGF